MEHTDAGVHTVLADVERPAEHDPFGDHSERVLAERPTQATPEPCLRPALAAAGVPPARSGSPDLGTGATPFALGPGAGADVDVIVRAGDEVDADDDPAVDDPDVDELAVDELAVEAADDPTGDLPDTLAPVIDLGLGDLLGEAMEWQERALCAQTDPEAFFPEKGGSTREAKRICSGCEVRAECLEYALENDERFGIWGGMSERERRKQRRRAV
ncbi:transcription factor WhiB [Frankia torreyi]|uniref:Transcriptional regulator WhiB n=1 Tax=Frankia torreyi TaxID=1856 RepID=A0A0D8BK63_9ACTN|nr:WhiB family transcriptional regulator [Frankia torreyi]KJE23777.1 transcription factor WhiB [Frankia torreyi]KQM05611.1 transcription factor WhiB [Frankia sp. CpI1-P]